MQDVANAIGAALGTVGATVDTIESLELTGEGGEAETKKARLMLLERTRERAISEVVRKGATRSEVYVHSEDVVDVAYVAGKVRVRVKAIGPLRVSSEREVVCGAVCDNPHWPFASEEDRERDLAVGLPSPNIEGVCVCLVCYVSLC